MCFSTSAGIDGLAVNGLVLPVEAFTVPLDHFVLILFLQREQIVNMTTPIIMKMQ
jgi:hypothetical protein